MRIIIAVNISLTQSSETTQVTPHFPAAKHTVLRLIVPAERFPLLLSRGVDDRVDTRLPRQVGPVSNCMNMFEYLTEVSRVRKPMGVLFTV